MMETIIMLILLLIAMITGSALLSLVVFVWSIVSIVLNIRELSDMRKGKIVVYLKDMEEIE